MKNLTPPEITDVEYIIQRLETMHKEISGLESRLPRELYSRDWQDIEISIFDEIRELRLAIRSSRPS